MAEALISEKDPWREPFGWMQDMLFRAFGSGTPRQQMVSSFLLAFFFYVASFVGLYVTLLLAFLFTITFFIGFVRLLWAAWSGG